MDKYLTIFLITLVTGAGGLALGAALAAAVHSPSDKMTSALLRFTAGVMLSVVCFDLVADALEESGVAPLLGWILAGFLGTYLLNCWVDKRAHHSHSHASRQPEHGHDHAHGHESGDMCACGRHTLHTAGLVLAAAVALHNMPVGMAIGATFGQPSLPGHAGHAGILAALIIGLHNIPEGMSIAAPLLTGGSRPLEAVGIAALSGLPTILGALLGYSAGVMDPALLGASLAFAAGAMLYVVFGELLPEAERLWQHRLSGLAIMLGLMLGMALIFSHTH